MNGTQLLAGVTGIVLWSLLEYVLHRFLGHDRRTMPNFFSVEHTRHHSEGGYFAPTWKKGLVAIVMSAAITGLVGAVLSVGIAVPFAVGFVGMYVAYEVVHRRLHTHRGVGAVGRYLRRHHFHHHFGNPRLNHGVTSPIWDVVFGTFQAPGVITVPEKLAMDWLVDPQTGDVHEDLATLWRLRRAAA
jgi:sterol desaturase/sphingolipid hydroxylase (fatty acid hydroxylase superfamily)